VPETIELLVRRGIPVVGHVGLRLQAANVDGGFKAKGRSAIEWVRALAEARAVDQAGAFAMVVEIWMTRSPAKAVSRRSALAPRQVAMGRSWLPMT
jgi:ketopantoate hydroxymethyltransferase